jgi:hypothetical protein
MASNPIKTLQTTHPRGHPIDTADLRRYGVSSASAHGYVKSGWLVRLGRGVFMFQGDTLERDASLVFLERKIPGLHVAGRTALAWQGHQQNLAHQETLALHGQTKAELPNWFRLRFPARYSAPALFDEALPSSSGLAVLPETPNGPLVSEPERALLEMLSEVGVQQEPTEARGIMESLRHIRRKELALLLQSCRMVKAARLCVVWAEELGLSWAPAAREAAAGRLGKGRWIKRLKNKRTLILKS